MSGRALSPFEVGIAAALGIHVVLIAVAGAMIPAHPPFVRVAIPHVEMVDVEVPSLRPPPPMTEPAPTPAALPAPPTVLPSPPTQAPPIAKPAATHAHAVRTSQPPATETPAAPTTTPTAPPTTTPSPTAGGDQVVHMDNIAPSATGVAAAVGPSNRLAHVGRGGSGGGTGSGSGDGTSAGQIPAAMSVATIKTRALPKPGFDYVDLGRDYPEEAKQLGIEGNVRVRLTVDTDGKVAAVRLLDHLGHGLDELAVARAKAIEFTPALDADNHAVTSIVVWTFAMHLPKS